MFRIVYKSKKLGFIESANLPDIVLEAGAGSRELVRCLVGGTVLRRALDDIDRVERHVEGDRWARVSFKDLRDTHSATISSFEAQQGVRPAPKSLDVARDEKEAKAKAHAAWLKAMIESLNSGDSTEREQIVARLKRDQLEAVVGSLTKDKIKGNTKDDTLRARILDVLPDADEDDEGDDDVVNLGDHEGRTFDAFVGDETLEFWHRPVGSTDDGQYVQCAQDELPEAVLAAAVKAELVVVE